MPVPQFPPLHLPAPPEFARQLHDALPLRTEVVWSTETGSTNLDVQARLRAPDLPAAVEAVVHGTHLQNAGRGRAGRVFQTRAGDALLVSAGFRLQLPLAALPALSVAAGLAACRALAPFLPDARGLMLKWPNDVLWRDAKLAGILVESALAGPVTAGYAEVAVVIGMGTNLRGGPALSAHLGRAVADWSQTGGQASAVQMVAALVLGWHAALHRAARDGLTGCFDDFPRFDALRDKPVRVIDGERVLFEGVAAGVEPGGRLRVRTADGERLVTVGDVSVRTHDGAAP